MAKNPAQSLVRKDRTSMVAEEQTVGDRFEGESERERKVGVQEEVVVDIFQRSSDATFFIRVSLRSMINSKIIMRSDLDLDKYSSKAEILKMVAISGGALAEQDCELRGANWDCEYVARQAQSAASDLLKEVDNQ